MNPVDTRSDEGLTLIELVIVIVLLGIMGSATLAIFINSWTTQNAVTTTSQATNRGQLVGSNIERAVRNADAIAISADGRYLAARVPLLDGTYVCKAFWVRPDAGGGSLVMSSAKPVLTQASATWPGPWITSLLVPHKVNNGAGVLVAQPFFSMTATTPVTIVYQYDISTTSAPVTITGRAYLRDASVIVSTDANPKGALPCWS